MLDAARWAVVVAAAALPFSTAATNLAMVLAVVAWAFSGQWRASARTIASQPAAWLGCALFAALLAGTAWSLLPSAEALASLNKYRELLYFGVVMFLFSDARWRARLLLVSFVSAVALLVLSFASLSDLLPLTTPAQKALEGAVLKKSSITHSFMMSLLCFAAAAAVPGLSGWRRWVMAGIAVLAALNVLVAIQSRTGYVVLAVLAVWLAASRWSVKGVAAALLVSLVAATAAYHGSARFQARIDQTVAESRQYEAAPSETSISLRRHYLKRSVEWIGDHPLAGAGTGAWGEAFYARTAGDPAFLHNREHRHPHNEYLNIGVQLGLGGMALLIALFAAAFRSATALPAQQALLARGVVVAFAVGCLFNDFFLDNTEGHIWAILGGALFGGSARLPGQADRA